MEHFLRFVDGAWKFSVFCPPGTRASDLELDVQPRLIRVQMSGEPTLLSEVPTHAVIDLASCASRFKEGVLLITWQPFDPGKPERECQFQLLSTRPLIYVADGFLTATECETVIAVARSCGVRRTGLGDHEVKYDMDTKPLLNNVLPAEQRASLESIYARIDAVCGVTRHDGEQCPRVHHYTAHPSRSAGTLGGRLPMGLHLDSNGRPHRYATAIVYLTTVPPAGDGATVFPCVGDEDTLLTAGNTLAQGGTEHTSNLADEDHLPLARRLTDAADRGLGLSVRPEAGKLCVFFTRTGSGLVDATSWHGGAGVTSQAPSEGKWILQFFKEIPAAQRGRLERRWCEGRRNIPQFTLHGIRHRCAQEVGEEFPRLAG